MMSINLRTTEKGDNHLSTIPRGLAVCVRKRLCTPFCHGATNIHKTETDDKTEQSLLFKRDLYKEAHNLKELSNRQQAQRFPNLFEVLQS